MLSICIPTLNRASYLKSHLDALLTFKDLKIEINISNNASTDNTLDIINEYKNKFEKFNYVSLADTVDVVANWDSAIRLATQKYVFAIADDDTCLESGLLEVIKMLEADNELIAVYGSFNEYNTLGENKSAKCEEVEIYNQDNRLNLMKNHWSLEVPIFRNKFYQSYALPHQNSWILSWTFLDSVLKKGKVAVTPIFIINHFIHNDRMTVTHAADSHFHFVLASEVEVFLANSPDHNNERMNVLTNFHAKWLEFNAGGCIQSKDLIQARFLIQKINLYNPELFKAATQQWDQKYLVRATAQEINHRIILKDYINRVIIISTTPKEHDFFLDMFPELPVEQVLRVEHIKKVDDYNINEDFLIFFDDKELENHPVKYNVAAFRKVMNSLKFTDAEIALTFK